MLTKLAYQSDLSPWLAHFAAHFGQPLLLLDSNQPNALGPARRFDLLFFAALKAWRISSDGQLWQQDAGQTWQPVAQGIEDWLAKLAPEPWPDPVELAPELPRPGLAGALSYDLGLRLQGLTSEHSQQAPLLDLASFGALLVMDHQQQQGYLWHQDPALLQRVQELLGQPPSSIQSVQLALTPEINQQQYDQAYQGVQQYLRAGDCYQINLTYRYQGRWHGCPYSAFRLGRQQVAGPFAALWQQQDLSLISMSPERFIAIDQGRIESRPIKGTVPRGQTPEQDRALQQQLANSSKDQAENVMIVDLLRNDLGKLALAGTVEVPELFVVESYANVHHLVSAIRAQLRPEITPLQALISCSPGGSITGAPKRRAMQIIDQLELSSRGHYCGSLFYWDSLNRLDSSILIRTLEVWQQECRLGTGGGVTLGSTAEGEYQESQLKVARFIQALQG